MFEGEINMSARELKRVYAHQYYSPVNMALKFMRNISIFLLKILRACTKKI